jgi:hypothetical protein
LRDVALRRGLQRGRHRDALPVHTEGRQRRSGLRSFDPFVPFCSLPASRRLGTAPGQRETKRTKRRPGKSPVYVPTLGS